MPQNLLRQVAQILALIFLEIPDCGLSSDGGLFHGHFWGELLPFQDGVSDHRE